MKDADVTEDSADSIVLECDLDAAPEKVWRALTVPELAAEWLTNEPTEPDIDCKVLQAEPNRLLRYSWRGADSDRDDSGNALDTVVTFTLTETESGGTHLRVEHSGFDTNVESAPQPEETLCSAAQMPSRAASRVRRSTRTVRRAIHRPSIYLKLRRAA
jgi:uncharacterized protein YndB with AHSA1/START domain